MANSSYAVTVVRDDGTWCAAVAGVEGAYVWGSDFEELEAGVRARLAEILGVADTGDVELDWHVDADGDDGRQTPVSPM
ncbi:MAG: hypothetical protein ACTH1D_11035 [Mycobacteriaceae bacterium]|uniref:hypothetical protein n=1 Tax=Corynebacterium sp. TaxID=1720 RepID=UPI003F970FB2